MLDFRLNPVAHHEVFARYHGEQFLISFLKLLFMYLTIADDRNILRPPPSVPLRFVRVGSGYIRRMNEERLLIPGRYIHLQDCCGQGKYKCLCSV